MTEAQKGREGAGKRDVLEHRQHLKRASAGRKVEPRALKDYTEKELDPGAENVRPPRFRLALCMPQALVPCERLEVRSP